MKAKVRERDTTVQSSLSKILKALAVIILIGIALVYALLDWKRTLTNLIAAVVIAIVLATVFYIPAFCYFALATRSVRESFSRSWELWKHVASEVFSQLN